MTILDEEIIKTLKPYEELRDFFKFELKHSPRGTLLHQMDGDRVQFIHYYTDEGEKVRKGINRNPDLIRALARKEFNRKASEILSGNIDAVYDALSKQIPFNPDQIVESMTKAYALVPDDYFFNGSKFTIPGNLDEEKLVKVKRHEEWWKKPYKEYWGYPQNKTRRTSRGQMVRSISELLIAEALYNHSIPFHYEEELEVDGKTFAPDFTFEDSSYKYFYLDYFGMMDNPKYAKKNFLKLDDYYDIGLIPGDNLIVAFDSKGVMNAGMIEAIIENEIFPRL